MGDSFSFQFKDRSEESIYYIASYSGGDNLKLEKHMREWPAPDPRPVRGIPIPRHSKLGPVSDPWPVFYANATFDIILHYLSLYGARKRYNEADADDSYHTYKPSKVKTKDGREIGTFVPNDETFLKEIRENPAILQFHSKTQESVARIIRDAWTGDAATRQRAVKSLKNLIPRHPGGRKHRPHGLELARTLLKKLANHLSKECINSLKGQGLWISKNVSLRGDDWHENYRRLIEWAKVHEHRISNLKPKYLEELIKTPAHYADSILSGDIQLGVRTIKTP